MSMIESMLNRFGVVATVKRATTTTGGFTGDTVTWNTHLTTEACLADLSGRDVEQCQKLSVVADKKAYCEYAEIQEKDRIIINSQTYHINYVQNPMSANRFLQLYLQRDDTL